MAIAHILLDHYPAVVETPDGAKYNLARVTVYDGLVKVWALPTRTSAPTVVFEKSALSVDGTRISGFNILTPDGVLRSTKARGCGCGNPLKSFDPYNGATRVRVPPT